MGKGFPEEVGFKPGPLKPGLEKRRGGKIMVPAGRAEAERTKALKRQLLAWNYTGLYKVVTLGM